MSKKSINQLELNLRPMRAQVEEAHEKIARVQERVAELERQAQANRSNIATLLRNDLKSSSHELTAQQGARKIYRELVDATVKDLSDRANHYPVTPPEAHLNFGELKVIVLLDRGVYYWTATCPPMEFKDIGVATLKVFLGQGGLI